MCGYPCQGEEDVMKRGIHTILTVCTGYDGSKSGVCKVEGERKGWEADIASTRQRWDDPTSRRGRKVLFTHPLSCLVGHSSPGRWVGPMSGIKVCQRESSLWLAQCPVSSPPQLLLRHNPPPLSFHVTGHKCPLPLSLSFSISLFLSPSLLGKSLQL